MVTQILTHHQVMPAYLDFMFVFGAQSVPRDLRFSGFREQVMLKDPPHGHSIPEFGRSGRQFKLCYNLKGVTLTEEDAKNLKNNSWSIRQLAVHHQFDVVYGTTLWIATKGRLDILDRFKQLTGPEGRLEDKSFRSVYECFRSSLAAHLMYCHWSTEDWHMYISWMEQLFESEAGDMLSALNNSITNVNIELNGTIWSARTGTPRVQALPHTTVAALEGQNKPGCDGTRSQYRCDKFSPEVLYYPTKESRLSV